ESFNIKVARFGDNMRNVAVTDGDKIEAQIQLGWVVDYYAIGDLTAVVNQVTEKEVESLFEEYKTLYELDYKNYDKEDFDSSVKEQIKYEIPSKKFLAEGGYAGSTTSFENLYGMKQLPGLSVQRLNDQGYGWAGEGAWKRAAVGR